MYKFWHVNGANGEYVFLTPTAKCETEGDVRSWVEKFHPTIKIKSVTEA